MDQAAQIMVTASKEEAEERIRSAMANRNFSYHARAGSYVRGIRGAWFWTVNGASLYRKVTYEIEPQGAGSCSVAIRQNIQGYPLFMNLADQRVLQEEFEDIVFFVQNGTEQRENRWPEYTANSRASAKFAVFVLLVALLPAVAIDQVYPWAGFLWAPIGLLLPFAWWKRTGGLTDSD